MAWIPSHKIYDTDGVSLIYTIEDVIRRKPALSIEIPDFVEHTSFRSNNSIIIPGGNKPYDMIIYARLGASNYTNLMTALSTLKSTIATKTKYYLKIDTSGATTDNIKVQRLKEIVVDPSKGNLNKFCYYTITLRCNAW